jgi:hypothetical protein
MPVKSQNNTKCILQFLLSTHNAPYTPSRCIQEQLPTQVRVSHATVSATLQNSNDSRITAEMHARHALSLRQILEMLALKTSLLSHTATPRTHTPAFPIFV